MRPEFIAVEIKTALMQKALLMHRADTGPSPAQVLSTPPELQTPPTTSSMAILQSLAVYRAVQLSLALYSKRSSHSPPLPSSPSADKAQELSPKDLPQDAHFRHSSPAFLAVLDPAWFVMPDWELNRGTVGKSPSGLHLEPSSKVASKQVQAPPTISL